MTPAAIVHGRLSTYVFQRCRCQACTAATTDRGRKYRTRIRLNPPVEGGLLTPCWCQTYLDLIAPIDVAQGRTWTCGQPDCQPPKETA